MPEYTKGNLENLEQKDSSSPKDFGSKKTFIFVGIIGVAALFLGFFQIYQNIRSPFQTALTLNSSTYLTSDQLQEIDSLKAKDTDSDGLLDYDELYYYNTSPYLKDSDSDGFTDKEELESNNDPNCPSGLDCSGVTTTVADTNTTSADENINSSLVSGNATTETLRETLKNAGVPQYILDTTTDEELLEVYNQTVSEGASPLANVSTSNTNQIINEETESTDEEVENILKTLTTDEIRELLMEYGLTEEELSQIDDNTLQAIFLQAIEEGEGL